MEMVETQEVQMEPYKYLWKVLCETLSKMVVDGEEVSPGDVLGVMAGMEAEVFDFNLEELMNEIVEEEIEKID